MRKKNYKGHQISIDKSPYLKKLEARKIEKITQNEEDKANYLLDKVLGNDKNFNRDYSVFFGCSIPPKSQSPSHKFTVYNPGLKLNLKTKTEELFPNKYNLKSIEYDKFSMIYKNNQNYSKGNTRSYKNKKNPLLSSAGASVIKSNRENKNATTLLITQSKSSSINAKE